MKLSDLIQGLVKANYYLEQAKRDEEVAREIYLEKGGYSWGYAGQSYHDDIHKARSKVETIKEEIDKLFPA